jgi:hypothetical protein
VAFVKFWVLLLNWPEGHIRFGARITEYRILVKWVHRCKNGKKMVKMVKKLVKWVHRCKNGLFSTICCI